MADITTPNLDDIDAHQDPPTNLDNLDDRSEVEDLDAEVNAAADVDEAGGLRREAEFRSNPEAALIRFQIAGHTFTVPPVGAWPVRATSAINRNDWETWAELVLSEDQADRFLDLSNDQAVRAVEYVQRQSGTTPGKSRPSSNSPRNGPVRSRRR